MKKEEKKEINKLPKNKDRLTKGHPRFPIDLLLKGDCKYCGRGDLVGGYDLTRTIDSKDEHCCMECFQSGRQEESGMVGLARALSGYNPAENKEFPLAPEKGTKHKEPVGRNCATCGKPIYWNPYKKKLIGAYNELLRGITVHEKCGVPSH